MSDQEAEGVVYDDDGNPVLNPKIREQMRRQERELKEANAKLRDADLRVVYAELGVSTEGPGKFFRDNYSGPTDKESVKTAALEAGAIAPAAPSSTPPPAATAQRELELQAELDALRGISGATSTTGTETGTSMNEMLAKLREAAKKSDPAEFDALLESEEMQRLGSQPISFL